MLHLPGIGRYMELHLTVYLIFCEVILCTGIEVACEGDRCYLEYPEWAVQVHNGALNAKYLADCMKAVFVSPIHLHKDTYLIRARKKHPVGLRVNFSRCRRKPYVIWIEEQIPRLRTKRSVQIVNWNDPLYTEMWYLVRGSENAGYDMNVLEAWHMNYTGNGVVLTIMDDGIDYTHTDLKRNYDPLASYDLIKGDPDPMPNLNTSESNKHGTRCAGQIAAEGNNSICMVGVAYNSRIGGIRMLGSHITDNLESGALAFRNDYIHIYSGSWGPEDTGKMYEGPGVLAQSAFYEGIVSGRHGLGSIYVWAAGNGGPTDSCACDGYASSIFTLSVNSVGEHNSRPSYLEQCSSTLVTTYSSGGHSEKMIATIDPQQKCTTGHTGTSASAPMAAGIVALLLEANPRLSWRDVQYITLLTANSRPFVDGNFTMNAAGRAYSSLYGYGLMDAGKMVRLGELWRGLPAHHRCISRIGNVSLKLEGRFNHTHTLNFSGCFPVPREDGQTYAAYARNSSEEGNGVRYLEHVQLYADISYQRRGVLQITLISPSGTETVLQPPRVLDEHSGNIGLLRWPLTTVQLWGESAVGVWQIRLDNVAGGELPQTKPDLNKLKGFWRSAWLVVYGTDEFPIRLRPPKPERPPPSDWFAAFSNYVINDSDWHKVFTCHVECAPGGCTGPNADQCLGGCLHFTTKFSECVSTCPLGTTPYGGLHVSIPARNDFWAGSQAYRTRINNNKPGRDRSNSNGVLVPKANVVCQPCWTLCAACVRPHTEYDCTACASGQYLVPLIVPVPGRPGQTNGLKSDWEILNVALPSIAGTCRSDCPPGFFVNKSTYTCDMCIENCAACTGTGLGQCSLCKPGFRLLLGRCVDGNSVDGRCGRGQYLDQSDCVACHLACEPSGCLPDGQCYKCKHGYPFLINGICVEVCPSGWYIGPELDDAFSTTASHLDSKSIRLHQCEPCPPGCLACRSLDVCDVCVPGLVLRDGVCANHSSVGQCGAQCATCTHHQNDCLTCVAQRLLISNALFERLGGTQLREKSFNTSKSETQSYTCVDHCPLGSFPAKSGSVTVCHPCSPSCADCLDELHCLSCRPPFYLDDKRSSCLLGLACRQSEFFDPVKKFCVACHPTCATCIGPGDTDCTSCTVHGPQPHCLSSKSSHNGLLKWKEDLPDPIHGQCVPCCAYKMVLLNRTPIDCMFCIAGKVTCLTGTDLNAGEGLLIEQTSAQSDSAHTWLLREPSRIVLLVLCSALFLGAAAFITAHATGAWRHRRSTSNAVAAIRRRRRLKEQAACAYTDVGDNGVRMALKIGDKPNLADTEPVKPTTALPKYVPPCFERTSRNSGRRHYPVPGRYSAVGTDLDYSVLYTQLTPSTVIGVEEEPNEVDDDTCSLPACTTHRSDEFCTRAVPIVSEKLSSSSDRSTYPASLLTPSASS